MRRCVHCQAVWPDTFNVCPDDGWALPVAAEAGAPESSTVIAADQPAGPVAAAARATQPAPELVVQDLPAGTMAGEYRIEAKIGEGGMGAVYAAVHPLIGKKAAIKVISAALNADASAVQRFIQEARSVNQIGHPNIVDVFAFGALPDGRNYFVMEHLLGEGLAQRLQRAPISLGETMEILDQVADALEAAHEHQIVHRDLKPDNVYLASVRGRTTVKLLDFGIAKLTVPGTNPDGAVAKTRTGMMMGTPGYLSPEQARGKNVDYRTDIYALGCMMYEMVCGRLPFIADNAIDVVLAHMTMPPPRPSELWPAIPPALDELMLRMISKLPEQRPSLPELRATLAALAASGAFPIDAGRPGVFGPRVATPGSGLPTPMGSAAFGTRPPVGAIGTTASGAAAPGPKRRTGVVVAAMIGALGIAGGALALSQRKGKTAAPPAPSAPAAPLVAGGPAPAPAPAPAAPAGSATPPAPATPPAAGSGATAPAVGTLAVDVDVATARIAIDGTPAGSGGKARLDLPPGPHDIDVSAPGYRPAHQTKTLVAGQILALDIALEHAGPATPPSRSSAPAHTGRHPKAANNPSNKNGKSSQTGDGDATIDPF